MFFNSLCKKANLVDRFYKYKINKILTVLTDKTREIILTLGEDGAMINLHIIGG